MRSHRAGRWAFDEVYAGLLIERGYCVDCSVTPGISWARNAGSPGEVGTDYRGFPERPYFIDPSDISRPGNSALLELPVTIQRSWLSRNLPFVHRGPLKRIVDRLTPEHTWLRPSSTNLERMLSLVDWAVASRQRYIEFMIHSSEFMPGGSPYFATEDAVQGLYDDLEVLFERIAGSFQGQTLSGFHDEYVADLRLNDPLLASVGAHATRASAAPQPSASIRTTHLSAQREPK
jgi:hypothetical protein